MLIATLIGALAVAFFLIGWITKRNPEALTMGTLIDGQKN